MSKKLTIQRLVRSAFLLITFVCHIFVANAKDTTTEKARFSNHLPTELVKELLPYMTMDSLDGSMNLAEAAINDLCYHLLSAKNGSSKSKDIQNAVNSLLDKEFFNSQKNEDQRKIYKIKSTVIRYFAQHPEATLEGQSLYDESVEVEQALKNRYIKGAIDTLKALKIPEYEPILKNVETVFKSNAIEVVDLSPTHREELQKQGVQPSHGTSLIKTEDNSDAKRFLVNGFYFENPESGRKIFAVDFSLPFSETIVTISHELVHAGDPELKVLYQQLKEMNLEVKSIILRLVPSTLGQEIAELGLRQVFLEINHEHLLHALQQSRQKIEELYSRKLPNEKYEVTESDRNLLHKWARTVIQLTIGNELKAYGLSMVAYNLLEQANLINPTVENTYLRSSLLAGDNRFANQLVETMNPFNGSTGTRKTKKEKLEEITRQLHLNEEAQLAYMRALNLIESIYMQEVTAEFQLSPTNKYKEILERQQIQLNQFPIANTLSNSKRSVLEMPSWSDKGQLNNPINPAILLTSPVSTYWSLRLKQNLTNVVKRLTFIKNVLINLRAGILDFSAMSTSDLKLLGWVNPQNDSTSSALYQCDSFKHDNSLALAEYQKYFPPVLWSLDSTGSDQRVPAMHVTKDLLKMELMQSLVWFDQDFFELKRSSKGSEILIEKIISGDYDTDITPERASEITAELRAGLGQVNQNTPQDLQQMQLLFDFLLTAHNITSDLSHQEVSWSQAAELFRMRREQALGMLDMLGFQTQQFDAESTENRWLEGLQKFDENVENVIMSQCEAMNRGGLFAANGTLDLMDTSLSVNVICDGRQAYLYKLPCELGRSPRAPQTHNGRPSIALTSDGRRIELAPWQELRKAGRKVP